LSMGIMCFFLFKPKNVMVVGAAAVLVLEAAGATLMIPKKLL
jgi:hypothetical protein